MTVCQGFLCDSCFDNVFLTVEKTLSRKSRKKHEYFAESKCLIASLPARLLGDKSRVKSCWGAGSSVSTTSTISEDVDGSRG